MSADRGDVGSAVKSAEDSEVKDSVDSVASSNKAETTRGSKPADNDEGLEIEGMGEDAQDVEPANDIEVIDQALNLLENPEADVNSDQLEKAINIAAEALDGINGIESERERDIKAAVAYALEHMNNDEQSREFLINYLKWCREQLNAQQNVNTLRVAALESAAVAPAVAPAPAPAMTLDELLGYAKALLSILITTPEGKEIQASLSNAETLKELGLEYAPGENGSGILTRVAKEGGSSPYSAHFTPDGNGGFKVAIMGTDPKQGLKDVLGVFKDAGVTAVNISGRAVENRSDAYQILRTALEVKGITSILGDEGVYGSVKLFAEEGAIANPTANEAETTAYLQSIVENDTLRTQLINGMVENQGANREELEGLSTDDLVENCLKAVMSQPAPEVTPTEFETQSETTLKSAPSAEGTPSVSVSNNGRTVAMNGVRDTSVTTSSTGSVISRAPSPAGRRPDPMVSRSADMAAAERERSHSPSANTSTMVMGGKEITVRHEESGTVTVNGHKMPGVYPYKEGMSIHGAADGKGVIMNGKHVEVTERGLKVDGQMVNPEAKSDRPGLLGAAATLESGAEGTTTPNSSVSETSTLKL